MKLTARKSLFGLIAISVVAMGVLFFRETPLRVDVGLVELGSMQVTLDEQGETRSHDRFVVTAPVAGKLSRIDLHDGDVVQENQVVARIAPLPLGVRELNEQQARLAAAKSQQREATELLRHAEQDLAQAKRESDRVERLVKEGFISQQAAEQARNAEVTIANEVEAARFRAKSAKADVLLAQSGLIAIQGGKDTLFEVRAPIAGHILRIQDPSERVVTAGAPLLTLGNTGHLEVVIEMLSTEATQVRPGMSVIIDGWGGNQPLMAQVRRVEPYAYTKLSALGIEEKRTNVIADLLEAPQMLGDGYRVMAHIVVWAGQDVVLVPASALFRCAEAWCAFVVKDGQALQRKVRVGQRNAQLAEVLEGLAVDETVIRHPDNQLTEGARVEAN